MTKKRVLLVNEASFLTTGYSTYGREVLRRLHATGKYDIAELGCYAAPEDLRSLHLDWKFYPNLPAANDYAGIDDYRSLKINEFGAWKFNEVCLDFKPDIVFNITDWWMSEYIERSPLRKHYHYAHMPTVDGLPLDDQWVATYKGVDSLFAYTDWGVEVLRQYGLNPICSAPPGADLATYYPKGNKDETKKRLGIPPDSLIVGTVMRNQIRKLFPDLIQAFGRFLEKAPSDIASRAYLYLHTGFPDLGYHLPRLIKESGCARKILMTYVCAKCGVVYGSVYTDVRNTCKACGGYDVTLVNSTAGIGTDQLADLYNLFDIYIQHSTCLKKGTRIYAESGWKNIEEVIVGDKVLTHTGNFKPVVRTFVNPPKKCIDITCWSTIEHMTITEEHPVLAITDKQIGRKNDYGVRGNLGYRLRMGMELPEPVFVPAGELKVGDMLAYVIDDSVVDKEFVDLSLYANTNMCCTDNEIRTTSDCVFNRFLPVNEDMCRFLGMFAAEGSSYGGRVYLTTHTREADLRYYVERFIPSIKEYPYKGRNAINQVLSSHLHSAWLAKECLSKENKKLPDWCLRLPKEKQQYILHGLFAGDGHYMEKNNTTVYTTISKTLSEQIVILLRRNRIAYNLRLRKKSGNRKPQYTLEVPGNLCEGEIVSLRNSSMGLYYKNYHYQKVKAITESTYSDNVYNFEVQDDNSYVTSLSCVHNCEGFGMCQVEAAACGVHVASVDYSAMEDVVRKLDGRPIKVQRFNREPNTHRLFAYPDNEDLADYLTEFLSLPESVRLSRGIKGREGVLKHYTYERTAKIWEECFDGVEPPNTWHSPAQLVSPSTARPEGLTDDEFVRWCISYVAGRPDLADSYMSLRLSKDLSWRTSCGGMGGVSLNDMSAVGIETDAKSNPYNRNDVYNQCLAIAEDYNKWERKRTGS